MVTIICEVGNAHNRAAPPHNLGSPMTTFKCSGSKASAHPRKFTLNFSRLHVSNKGILGSTVGWTESAEKALMTYLDQLEIGTFVDSYELCRPVIGEIFGQYWLRS